MNSICYVTAFLDIEREKWTKFQRSFEEYFKCFTPLVDLVKKDSNSQLVIFIDKKHFQKVKSYVGEETKNITMIEIDEDYLNKNSVLWSRLNREQEIMNSSSYKKILAHRLQFPEHNNPRYTLINHAKIDFVILATKLINYEFFCWIDFGYFQHEDRIPKKLLDIQLLDKNRVNYTLINKLIDEDKSIFYTLINAPEKIGGFFFFGPKTALQEYQKLFHDTHKWFQDNNLADDDQHLALQCYFKKPDLFCLHYLGAWHKALSHFQLKTNYTYISNNCGNLTFYFQENREYDNPFIGLLFVNDKQYIKFCLNFNYYISVIPKFGEPDPNSLWAQQNKGAWYKHKEITIPYPVMYLDDIEIHWIHEQSNTVLLDKYMRRLERLKTECKTPVFLFSSADLCNDHTEEEYTKMISDFLSLSTSIYLTKNEKDLELDLNTTKSGRIKLIKRWVGLENTRNSSHILDINIAGDRLADYRETAYAVFKN